MKDEVNRLKVWFMMPPALYNTLILHASDEVGGIGFVCYVSYTQIMEELAAWQKRAKGIV